MHTGKYADAKTETIRKNELKKIVVASRYVIELGIGLNAGHGLDYNNTVPIAKIDGMNELNIGFSIISRAMFVGLFQAVKQMKTLINSD